MEHGSPSSERLSRESFGVIPRLTHAELNSALALSMEKDDFTILLYGRDFHKTHEVVEMVRNGWTRIHWHNAQRFGPTQ